MRRHIDNVENEDDDDDNDDACATVLGSDLLHGCLSISISV